VKRIPAPAKLNLALVVGPRRDDGRHEVTTVLQRLDLADRVTVEPAGRLTVSGFDDDTLVHAALECLAAAAGVESRWRARIEKRIPVASGLAGGSSDAAAALLLANRTLPRPLDPARLHSLAAGLGTDVPFLL
jgi:4-diphosphocytidyl-2-C-methyl-D-erythritol kinase